MNDKDQEMTQEEAEAKIIHILRIYPIISPTMLQSGIGAYIKPAIWRPALLKLIEEGRVVEQQESLQTPTGRYNLYTKLALSVAERDAA